MNINKIQSTVQLLVKYLVDRDYEKLVLGDYQKQLTTDEIELAIKEYGGVLTEPPSDSFQNIEVYEISKIEIVFDFNLWIDNIKSDLTLSGTIVSDGEKLNYSIENIHVL